MIVQDFVESGKLEEDTGVVEPSVEVISLQFGGNSLSARIKRAKPKRFDQQKTEIL